MRRFFIIASAAIVAFASCAKTQVVHDGEPQEITFKAVSGSMVKSPIGDHDCINMGVFANKTTDKVPYLTNKKFVDRTTHWGGETPQYWPLEGNLDFVVYAPYSSDVTWTYDSTPTSELTITVDNTDNTALQTDWLYGKNILVGKVKNNDDMPISLRHALAKMTVNVRSDLAGFFIKSLVVKNTYQSGTLTVDYTDTDADYTDGDGRLSWGTLTQKDWPLIGETLIDDPSTKLGTGTFYLIPSAQTSLVLTYRLPEAVSDNTYTHTFNSSEQWIDGFSYVYDITVGINEIKFNPTVEDWTVDSDTDISLDPNVEHN